MTENKVFTEKGLLSKVRPEQRNYRLQNMRDEALKALGKKAMEYTLNNGVYTMLLEEHTREVRDNRLTFDEYTWTLTAGK